MLLQGPPTLGRRRGAGGLRHWRRRRRPHRKDACAAPAPVRRRRPRAMGADEGTETDVNRRRTASGPSVAGRAHRLQDRAAGVGFDWPDLDQLQKVSEELGEVQAHLPTGASIPDSRIPRFPGLVRQHSKPSWGTCCSPWSTSVASARFTRRWRSTRRTRNSPGGGRLSRSGRRTGGRRAERRSGSARPDVGRGEAKRS